MSLFTSLAEKYKNWKEERERKLQESKELSERFNQALTRMENEFKADPSKILDSGLFEVVKKPEKKPMRTDESVR